MHRLLQRTAVLQIGMEATSFNTSSITRRINTETQHINFMWRILGFRKTTLFMWRWNNRRMD